MLLGIMLVTEVTKHTELNRESSLEGNTTTQKWNLLAVNKNRTNWGAGIVSHGNSNERELDMQERKRHNINFPSHSMYSPVSLYTILGDEHKKAEGAIRVDMSFSFLGMPPRAKHSSTSAYHCSLVPSVASDEHLSVFFDLLCSCSCSFFRSFSLCFSIFSWAFRAFSKDAFISFSFLLMIALSWEDVIPRAWGGENKILNHFLRFNLSCFVFRF